MDIEKNIINELKNIDEITMENDNVFEENINEISDTIDAKNYAVNEAFNEQFSGKIEDKESQVLEESFDSDISNGLNFIASGYNPEEAYIELEKINNSWEHIPGDNYKNMLFNVLSDYDTIAAAQHEATYEGGWDEVTGKPIFSYKK